METSGPGAGRAVLGPLRRLVWTREVPRPAARRRFWVYALPLALLALVGLAFAANAYLRDNRTLPEAATVLLAAGTVLPVVVAWRRPVLAWRLAFLMLIIGVINATPREAWPWNPVQIFVFLFVLGRLAVTSRESGLTIWATALGIGGVLVFAAPGNAAGAGVLLVAIAAVGDIFARRRRTSRLLAEQTELNELERARRAVLEERTRIAREMHDVVAHHMSMIAVRAETAPYRVAGMPPEAEAEMAGIAAAAREALTDMRRLLGVLRSERDEMATAPQPGLADVDALAATARDAGLDVSLELDGLAGVPGTVGLTAYRIVQEALANAARHAPDGPVSVVARGSADHVEIAVRNPLPAMFESRAGGHGLAGMRERATLLGGTLSAGPQEGQFVVRALLPITGEMANNDQGADRG